MSQEPRSGSGSAAAGDPRRVSGASEAEDEKASKEGDPTAVADNGSGLDPIAEPGSGGSAGSPAGNTGKA